MSHPDGEAKQNQTDATQLPRPVVLWIVTALTVFTGEIIVMFILALLPPLPTVPEALLDGFMITVMATPAFYFFLYRPMVRNVSERRAAEAALVELNNQLEARVADRTAKLAATNKALNREVEERRQTERSLLKTNTFVQQVLEAAPCMLMIFDADSLNCTYVNAAVSDLLGYTPDQVQLSDRGFFAKVLDAEGRARLTQHVRELADPERESVIARFDLTDAEGNRRPFRVKLCVFSKTALSEPELILWSAIDLSRIS